MAGASARFGGWGAFTSIGDLGGMGGIGDLAGMGGLRGMGDLGGLGPSLAAGHRETRITHMWDALGRASSSNVGRR